MHDGLKTFARAVGWGTLMGGGPFLLLTVPVVAGSGHWGDLLEMLYSATMPLLIAGTVTLAAAVLIGLPLTAILRHLKAERSGTYGLIGALCGFLVPMPLMLTMGLDWSFLILSLPGLLAGTAAATVWGNWRERVAADVAEPAAELRPDRGERWLR